MADYKKRAFTLGEFALSFLALRSEVPSLLRLYLGPRRLDPTLRERVMLAVAMANECRH